MKPLPSRLSKVLFRPQNRTFFYELSTYNLGICRDFVAAVTQNRSCHKIKVSVATKNPKRKGWVKIYKKDCDFVYFRQERFVTCCEESQLLIELGIEDKQFFWLKIEVLG